ncbi:MAG: deoxyuridine 5'-triphosphate nucleotidohydrolase [Candidatus Aenigmatarchaeota archaeon]
MILSKEEILERINKDKLIEDFLDLDKQAQPASFDLTLREVYNFESFGQIDFSNQERKLPNLEKIKFKQGWLKLNQGCYLITFNEIVNVPNDLMAFLRPRSSLVRMGATVVSSLWDPGYQGRSNSLLVVFNKNGIKIKENARIAQFVFLKLNKPTNHIYSGIYKGENISKLS